jgi:hypothetical protein
LYHNSYCVLQEGAAELANLENGDSGSNPLLLGAVNELILRREKRREGGDRGLIRG